MVSSLHWRGQRLAPAWAWLGTGTVVAPIGMVWPTWYRGWNWLGVTGTGTTNGMAPIVRTWLSPVGFNPDHGQEMSVARKWSSGKTVWWGVYWHWLDILLVFCVFVKKCKKFTSAKTDVKKMSSSKQQAAASSKQQAASSSKQQAAASSWQRSAYERQKQRKNAKNAIHKQQHAKNKKSQKTVQKRFTTQNAKKQQNAKKNSKIRWIFL